MPTATDTQVATRKGGTLQISVDDASPETQASVHRTLTGHNL